MSYRNSKIRKVTKQFIAYILQFLVVQQKFNIYLSSQSHFSVIHYINYTGLIFHQKYYFY